MSKTILELQEELEKVIPVNYSLSIENYRPEKGGEVVIKYTGQQIDWFYCETFVEILEQSVFWFKNHKP